jgi:hypothetical protein
MQNAQHAIESSMTNGWSNHSMRTNPDNEAIKNIAMAAMRPRGWWQGSSVWLLTCKVDAKQNAGTSEERYCLSFDRAERRITLSRNTVGRTLRDSWASGKKSGRAMGAVVYISRTKLDGE